MRVLGDFAAEKRERESEVVEGEQAVRETVCLPFRGRQSRSSRPGAFPQRFPTSSRPARAGSKAD